MPRLRVGSEPLDFNLHGSVWDAADLLTVLARTNLRSFITGPWGPGDEDLAKEMIKRCASAPCGNQCSLVTGPNGNQITSGCTCTAGWQYTSDEDAQVMEGCAPRDVWSDARGLLIAHEKMGLGNADPIRCDCDDLTAINAATAKYAAWKHDGSPKVGGRPADGDADVRIAITRPRGKNMAHAYILTSMAPLAGEPDIKLRVDGRDLNVFDPAGRWGMTRPTDDFYGDGEVAVYPLRFADL